MITTFDGLLATLSKLIGNRNFEAAAKLAELIAELCREEEVRSKANLEVPIPAGVYTVKVSRPGWLKIVSGPFAGREIKGKKPDYFDESEEIVVDWVPKKT